MRFHHARKTKSFCVELFQCVCVFLFLLLNSRSHPIHFLQYILLSDVFNLCLHCYTKAFFLIAFVAKSSKSMTYQFSFNTSVCVCLLLIPIHLKICTLQSLLFEMLLLQKMRKNNILSPCAQNQ